jgi:N-acetylglucosamine kinase-like BadF-type ATPase
MKIIAESGSTKTDWVIVKNQTEVIRLTTGGYNPNYFPPSALEQSLAEFAHQLDVERVASIHFYGSGCSTPATQNLVGEILKHQFPGASAEVHHDLFGAARALFGRGSGIASILGTGSSSCVFTDGVITSAVPSLGYLLADEGSGADIGKLLLNAYFKNELPPAIHQEFEEKFAAELQDFIPRLYARQDPASFIASFVPFVVAHRQEDFARKLVRKAFNNFFDEIISKYEIAGSYPLGFVGSIAHLFADILLEIAAERSMHVSTIIRKPIDALVKFHSA